MKTAENKKAADRRKAIKALEQKQRQEAFDKQCADNEAKGLTRSGFTKTFDGQSIVLYIDNKKMTCTVEYDICDAPHMEFQGEPNILTETGYRSHFLDEDLAQYRSLADAVADQVEYIIRNRYLKNSKAKYTLSWEPNLEYLKDKQLTMFGGERWT